MNSPATREQSGDLSESLKLALLNLLADDDPNVYQLIRQKIISHGVAAREWLSRYTLSNEPVLRRRAQEIIQHLDRQTEDNRFLGFCLSRGEELDLEEGAWLLAKTQYPEINIAAYQALFDSYAWDLRERIDPAAPGEKILETVNHYLFKELGFTGNRKNYYEPDNSYLNRVADRRMSNPLGLCLVYLLLARRLQLPVTGIGMPGHFICRFQSSTNQTFIDPFNEGKLLTRADCVQYLIQTGFGFKEQYLVPTSPRRILLRVCSNLHQVYSQLELEEEKARLQRYVVALSN